MNVCVSRNGSQVAVLQADLLALKDSPGPLDGIFGPRTQAAVRAFQRQEGLTANGVANAATWNAIDTQLTKRFHATTGSLASIGAYFGDVGASVLQMQQDLAAKGFNPGPENGVFLWNTAHAVQAFERSEGFPLNDHVSGATLAALMGTAARNPGSASGSGSSDSGSGSGAGSSSGSSSGSGSGSGSATGSGAASGSGSVSSGTIDGHSIVREINLTATAYAPTAKDNYPYGPVDYYGHPLVAGDVAVDPNVIPLGTLLWVTGYSSPNLPAGGFLAHAVDEGGAIKGDRIDIFINQSESIVSNFGIQPVKAYILK